MIRTNTKQSIKTDGNKVLILGTKIDSKTKAEVLTKVRDTISKNSKLSIVTPNPEIVLQAQNDPDLMNSINKSDIAIADGVGLLWAERKLYKTKNLNLIKGRELFIDLIKLADENTWNVILIGDRDGSAQKAKEKLEEEWKSIKLSAFEGANLTLEGGPVTNEDSVLETTTIREINRIRPKIIFIGFGAPRQEKWLQKWLPKINCNVGMVVGGTFDYMSGKASLPPTWWPDSFEWLWRLFTKPGHLKRVWNALVVFPLKVISATKR